MHVFICPFSWCRVDLHANSFGHTCMLFARPMPHVATIWRCFAACTFVHPSPSLREVSSGSMSTGDFYVITCQKSAGLLRITETVALRNCSRKNCSRGGDSQGLPGFIHPRVLGIPLSVFNKNSTLKRKTSLPVNRLFLKEILTMKYLHSSFVLSMFPIPTF